MNVAAAVASRPAAAGPPPANAGPSFADLPFELPAALRDGAAAVADEPDAAGGAEVAPGLAAGGLNPFVGLPLPIELPAAVDAASPTAAPAQQDDGAAASAAAPPSAPGAALLAGAPAALAAAEAEASPSVGADGQAPQTEAPAKTTDAGDGAGGAPAAAAPAPDEAGAVGTDGERGTSQRPAAAAPAPPLRDGERELGRRETGGGGVVAGSRGQGSGEAHAARTGVDVGPSAPSPLSPEVPAERGGSDPVGSDAGALEGRDSARSSADGEGRSFAPEDGAARSEPVVTVMGRGSDAHHDGARAARAAEPGAPAPGALASPVREPSRTQPPPPPPAAALDVERFLRVEQFRSHTVRDGGEMRLQLSPDGLGEVHVRVVVRADAVEAALYAQHDHAREALQQHRPALEAALGRANLRLEGFTVGLGEHRHAPSDHSHAGTYQPPVVDADALAAPVAAQPAELHLGSERGLSLRA